MHTNTHRFLFLMVSVVLITGCAEGMFWKSGYLSPWVRQRWSAEEEIASTLFARREKMNELVDSALAAGESRQKEASQYLAEIVTNDPVLLLRIEATRLLGDLSTETSANALQVASRDREVEVRRAAVKSLERIGGDLAGQLLAQMAKADSDIDVRISATAALGRFKGAVVQRTLADVIEDPNPALQLRAAESLATVTGQSFGNDLQAWQEYLSKAAAESDTDTTRTAEDDGKQQSPLFR